jgi:hypothetical protein
MSCVSFQITRIEYTRNEFERLRNEHQKASMTRNSDEHGELLDVIDRINRILQDKWHTAQNNYGQLQLKEYHMNEYIRQMEFDIDDNIEQMKNDNELEFNRLNDNVQYLTMNVRYPQHFTYPIFYVYV